MPNARKSLVVKAAAAVIVATLALAAAPPTSALGAGATPSTNGQAVAHRSRPSATYRTLDSGKVLITVKAASHSAVVRFESKAGAKHQTRIQLKHGKGATHLPRASKRIKVKVSGAWITAVRKAPTTRTRVNLPTTPGTTSSVDSASPVSPVSTSSVTAVSSRPGPGNTGVPAGTVLTAAGVPVVDSQGLIYLNTSGAVYDGKLFAGGVRVNAANVTIRNSLVRGQIIVNAGGSLTITDSEVTGTSILPVCDTTLWNDRAKTDGLRSNSGASLNAARLNIHDFGKAAMIAGNATIADSWLHGFTVGYCDGGGAATHSDGVFVWPSSGNRLTGNFIDAGYASDGSVIGGQFMTAAILLHGDPMTHSNSTYDGNTLGGGGYIVYCANSGPGMLWTNNKFLRDANFPNGGIWGPRTAWTPTAGATWTGNTWADNGTPIN